MEPNVNADVISRMFQPALSGLARQAIAKAEDAARTLNQVSENPTFANPEDPYNKLFFEELAKEPMRCGTQRKVGIINGFRRIFVNIINQKPMTPRLICDLHNEVSELQNPKLRGLFRTQLVKTNDPEAIFATPGQVGQLLAHACFCYQTSGASPLTKAIALEAAVECIHPFFDANGRCSRLVLAETLIENGLPPVAFPTKALLVSYHKATKAWIRQGDADALMTLIATRVDAEAKSRLFYAVF